VSVADIAAAAAVSPPLIVFHFGTKKALNTGPSPCSGQEDRLKSDDVLAGRRANALTLSPGESSRRSPCVGTFDNLFDRTSK
jgi:hypothetical protein